MDPMSRTVSILINNYNYGRFLRQAIDSTLAQTYPKIEVVVVDDGSTDESRKIILSYGDKIRPVFKENGGQASAFNAGFAATDGGIVMFLDADDYYATHAVERIVAEWNEETRILHHRLREVDAVGNELGWNPVIEVPLDAGDVVPVLLKKGIYEAPPTTGLVYRRDILQKILPMPEVEFRICADTYLSVAAAFCAPVTVLDETMAYYRVHAGNAHRETGPRRHWQRRKLEVAQRNNDTRYALIKKLAAEHGFPVPDSDQWIASAQLFERLLLLRSSPPYETKLGKVVALILRKVWSERALPLSSRLRVTVLSVLVWLAPRASLRRIYPHIFDGGTGADQAPFS
jgi:glycosyltransferase involved in cell wall biosynthesis